MDRLVGSLVVKKLLLAILQLRDVRCKLEYFGAALGIHLTYYSYTTV